MNKILVTGSEGFIGRNLCSFLRKRGFDVIEHDIKKEAVLCVDFSEIDALIHLGANSSTTETDFRKIMKQNYYASMHFYDICKKFNIKFQYASSASVYGHSKSFQESDLCLPLNPYGFSKYMFDAALFNQTFPYQGFRYFNVYGDDEKSKGNQASPIYKFVQQAKNNGKIEIFQGSADMIRDFIWVEDVCEVHWKMLHSTASGVFNVGTGRPMSFLDVAKAVAEKYSAEIIEIPMPHELQDHYQYFTKADNSKLSSVIKAPNWKSVCEFVRD